METTMPQIKSDSKLLNRVFALIFALIVIAGMYYLVTSENSAGIHIVKAFTEKTGSSLLAIIITCSFFLIGFTLVVIALLIEAWKPSFDFTLTKEKKLAFASIVLFLVFISYGVWWWIVHGLPNWLPQHGLRATITEYLLGNFANDTSVFSLLFAILFLTKTSPQKSSSYKIMLIGEAIIQNLLFFQMYILSAFGIVTGIGVSAYHENFWGFTIFQPWFWFDFISEIVIFAGAVWLLRRNLKTVILAVIAFFLIMFLPTLLMGPPG